MKKTKTKTKIKNKVVENKIINLTEDIQILSTFEYLFHLKENTQEEYNLSTAMAVGKTKHIALALVDLIFKTPNVHILALRHQQSGPSGSYLEYLQQDVQWGLDKWKLKEEDDYTSKSRHIETSNGSKIDFHSLYTTAGKSNAFSGWSSNLDGLCVIWLEERYQFSDDDVIYIKNKIRGFKRYIFINSSNPMTFSKQYVRYCHKNLPYDLEILMKEGEQKLITKDKYFHYGGVEINLLNTEADKKKARLIRDTDEERAKTTYYGYPGSDEGLVYSESLKNMKVIEKKEDDEETIYQEYKVGINWDFRNKGYAVVLIGFTSNYQEAIVIDCIRFDTRIEEDKLSYKEIINNVYNKLKVWYKEYQMKKPLVAHIGYKTISQIDSPQTVVNDFNRLSVFEGNSIYFTLADALPIKDRISLVVNLLNNERLIINEKAGLLLTEMENIGWETKANGDVIRENQYDDLTCALDNAIITRRNTLYKTFKKNI